MKSSGEVKAGRSVSWSEVQAMPCAGTTLIRDLQSFSERFLKHVVLSYWKSEMNSFRDEDYIWL